MERNSNTLTLPLGIVGKADIGRLLRQVEELDDFLKQAAIRQPGTAVVLPKTSRLVEETILANKLNVLLPEHREMLLAFVKQVKAKAPVLHISFSADPSPLFMQRLMTWLRTELHPHVLLQVGLQPNIGAGCIVRTTNQYFDFSLKHRFAEKRDTLGAQLRGGMV